MSLEKYIVNFGRHIVPVDANTVAVISSKEHFSIKGTGMSAAVENILKSFKMSTSFDDAVSVLSNKYSAATLRKMLDLFVEKGILIRECDLEALSRHDETFLEKTFFYTKGDRPLHEIIYELSQVHIGIIGTNRLVHSLLDELIKGCLLTNFCVGTLSLNKEANAKPEANNVNITEYPLHSDLLVAQKIIDDSDIIIAACNYFNHYFFNQVNEMCFKANKKWLRVVIDGSNIEIGPLFIPGKTCCYSCLQAKLYKNTTDKERIFEDLYASKEFHEITRDKTIGFSSLYPLNSIAAGIASSEIMKYFTDMKCNLENEVLMIDCLNFDTQKAYIFKEYSCEVCAHKDVFFA